MVLHTPKPVNVKARDTKRQGREKLYVPLGGRYEPLPALPAPCLRGSACGGAMKYLLILCLLLGGCGQGNPFSKKEFISRKLVDPLKEELDNACFSILDTDGKEHWYWLVKIPKDYADYIMSEPEKIILELERRK